MTELHKLHQFSQLFDEVKLLLKKYSTNLKNELFEKEPNEENEVAYARGEMIFDDSDDDLKNITELLEKEDDIIDFFVKCRENKQKLLQQRNSLITKLVRMKKNSFQTKEEWLNFKEEWNKKREETPEIGRAHV